MQRVFVNVDGYYKEVTEIFFSSCTVLPTLNYSVSPHEGRDRAPHWFDTLTFLIPNRVITWQYFDIFHRSRSSQIFVYFRDIGDSIGEVFLV